MSLCKLVERQWLKSTPYEKFLLSGMMPNTKPDVNQAISSVYRAEWGRIVATLIRLMGDFDLAEEAAQEAFIAAVNQWQSSGIPALPRTWIIQTARYKAIDRLRRRSRLTEKLSGTRHLG